MSIRERLSGNEAAATAMKQINPDVVAAFPITPSTEIPQYFSTFVDNGVVDTEFVAVESEHSAMSACIGAEAGGARVLYLVKIGSFRQLLKSRSEFFEDARRNHVDLFIVGHVKVGRAFHIHEQIFGPIVLEDDGLPVGVCDARNAREVLVGLRDGDDGIGVNRHFASLRLQYSTKSR